MEKEKIRERLKLIGVIGLAIGIMSFILSWHNMIEATTFGTIGELTESLFFGLLGMTSFISGTIVYIKSMDFILP
jgi:hypothetical protein